MKKLILAIALMTTATTSMAGVVKSCFTIQGHQAIVADAGDKYFVYDAEMLAANIYEPIFVGTKEDKVFGAYGVSVGGQKFTVGSCVVTDIQMPDVQTAAQPDEQDEIVSDADTDAAGHGSEFEERGDIARPEYKGANTFIGDAYDRGGNSLGKVTLVRAENGDITAEFLGYDKMTFKQTMEFDIPVGEYDSTRFTTEFGVAKGPGFTYMITVSNTKIVK